MNLVEHYIQMIYSVEDITNEFEFYMKSEVDPTYIVKEKIYKVRLLEDCYGVQKVTEQTWRKSEYETNIKRGYYLG